MTVTPDSTDRILLPKEILRAINLQPGQALEVSIRSGTVILDPVPIESGLLAREGKLKVFTGKIPEINVEEAILESRNQFRL